MTRRRAAVSLFMVFVFAVFVFTTESTEKYALLANEELKMENSEKADFPPGTKNKKGKKIF